MFSTINSFGIYGIGAGALQVEVDVSGGLPAFDLVGLPGPAVKESRDRVRAAIKNSGFTFSPSRITVNLAPADLPKEGPVYDLPILVGLLEATGQIKPVPPGCAFAGELSLKGEARPSAGILLMALEAARCGIRTFYVPAENALEGGAVPGVTVVPVRDVTHLCALLDGREQPERVQTDLEQLLRQASLEQEDFSEVRGQENVKRALEIAAAGGHNVLLVGPPGSGKSMLAKRMSSILPALTPQEALEVTQVHSVAGLLTREHPVVALRPFRTPHHTISAAGLTGGGRIPRPGELSLAHKGILFLDELPEFGKNTLESLRQPLENQEITVSRVAGARTYPCDVTLICAMNPCPCGYYGSGQRQCTCTPPAISKYLSRVSGPLLDRMDLHVDVRPVSYEKMQETGEGEWSAVIRQRVEKARAIQAERFSGLGYLLNCRMPHRDVVRFCRLDGAGSRILQNAFESFSLTARSYDRILRVARTVADLEGSERISAVHVAEAVQYRSMDRKYWAQGV